MTWRTSLYPRRPLAPQNTETRNTEISAPVQRAVIAIHDFEVPR
jgi:hypothetical protein